MQRLKLTLCLVLLALLIVSGATATSADGPEIPTFELFSFGNAQPDPSQFLNDPRGIDVDGAGNAYVTDFNQRLLSYDANGNLRFSVGRYGSGDAQFSQPTCVVVSSNTVRVTDRQNLRYQNFDINGVYLSQTAISANEAYQPCTAVATDSSGNVWRVDRANHRITKTNSTGIQKFSIGQRGMIPGQLSQPGGMVLDGNYLLVTDSGNHRVQRFNLDGQYVSSFGNAQEITTPYAIAASDNLIGVVDYWDSRVALYDKSFNFLRHIGMGYLQNPLAIEFTKEGNILVADLSHSVKVLNQQGDLLETVGSYAAGIFHPEGITQANNGHFMIANAQNGPDGNILELNKDGQRVRVFAGNLNNLTGIDIKDNVLYAAHGNSVTAYNFDSGQVLTSWPASGSNVNLHSIVLDNNGNAFASDASNNRIIKFGMAPLKAHSVFFPGNRWMFDNGMVLDNKASARQTTSSRHFMDLSLKPGNYVAFCPSLPGTAGCRLWADKELVLELWNGILPSPSRVFHSNGNVRFTLEVYTQDSYRYNGLKILEATRK